MDITAKGAAYADMHGLAELKAKAGQNPDDEAVLRQVAAQFEGMFTQMLLKAQRDAGFGDPLFDSNAMGFYKDMHDKQLSVHMAENGGVGLADMIVAQLSRGKQSSKSDGLQGLESYFQSPVTRAAVSTEQAVTELGATWGEPREFAQQLWPHAQRGGEELGVDPRLLMAQAALETGWGEHVPSDARGSSFNVFGIKAQSDWSGERLWKQTLEFQDGQFDSVKEPFRRYQSLGESVDDYVQFLQQNPRYQTALDAAGQGPEAFATELGAAGYATDPEYAQKIIRVINSEAMQWLHE